MKRFLVLACAALTLGVAGCQDSTNPSAVLSGTYTLRTVNGNSLPTVTYEDATLTEEVLSGQITLDRNGNYTDVVTLRDTYHNGSGSETYTDPINGYWTLSGDQLTLTNQNNPNNPYYATVSGGQLTVSDNITGGISVYSK